MRVPVVTPQRLPSARSFARRATELATASIATQVLIVAAAPFLTRIFDPAAYGLWAALRGGGLLVSTIAALRLELAIVVTKQDQAVGRVVRLCVLTVLLMSLFAAALVYTFSGQVAALFGSSEVRPWLWYVPISALVLGLGDVGRQVVLRRQHTVFPIAASEIGRVVMTLAIQIAAGIWSGGAVWALIVGAIAGQALGLALLSVSVGWKLAFFRLPRRRHDRLVLAAVLRRHRDFPLFVAPFGFVTLARTQLVLIGLSALVSPFASGIYAVSFALVNAPSSLVARALREVFYPRAASAQSLDSLIPFLRSVFAVLATLVGPAAAFAVVNANQIVQFVLSDDWAEAGPVVAVLVPPVAVTVFSAWLDRLYHVAGRQRSLFYYELAFGVVGTSALLVVLMIREEAYSGIVALACVTLLYNLTWFIRTLVLVGMRLRSAVALSVRYLFAPFLATTSLLMLMPGNIILQSSVFTIYLALSSIYIYTQLRPGLH